MSDDEFDNIPDEFANVEDIDWATLLSANGPAPATGSATLTRLYNIPPTGISQPGEYLELRDELIRDSPFPEPESRSSVYFSDSHDMDLAFLAELDSVEQQVLLGRPPSASAAQSSAVDSDARSSTTRLPHVEDVRKSRLVQNVTQIVSPLNGKAKETFVQDILSAYEDELTCPICCDLLVASHVGNPCGHTFCGECGWQWHVEKKNKGCPCCRQSLDKSVPMIPNIAMDNTVEQHVRALAINGATEWETEGRKYMEWISRKRLWQQGGKKRERRKVSLKPAPIEMSFDAFESILEQLQESDEELIPRPIRRARHRPGPRPRIRGNNP